MSKRALEAGLKAYPENIIGTTQTPLDKNAPVDANVGKRIYFMEGYKQAEKDIISHIRNQVKLWMPYNQEKDEYIEGKRFAFRSVLVLLNVMEEK